MLRQIKKVYSQISENKAYTSQVEGSIHKTGTGYQDSNDILAALTDNALCTYPFINYKRF